ncbi:hypothetical protein ONZ43_g5717 [Nemania bipapillata]|uniref:Uncharacterized protein n=1 Tax=Nemania bipapillata TaxID=110536 RepID=A0ACC2I7D5_9PEZI|nr:hypothetical protein ONZ43_g5717 [Nemania bipapillata]
MSTTQLSRLLPLPDEELKQVLDYATGLSKSEAADHFRNLLGDSPEAIDFIASFNARRQDPSTATAQGSGSGSREPAIEPVPKFNRGQGKKKKASLHTPAPRRVVDSSPHPARSPHRRLLH